MNNLDHFQNWYFKYIYFEITLLSIGYRICNWEILSGNANTPVYGIVEVTIIRKWKKLKALLTVDFKQTFCFGLDQIWCRT
jgi:hypothetical protein